MKITTTILSLFVLLITACAPMAQTPNISSDLTEKEAALQREIVVREMVSKNAKLQTIAQPILIKNAELCGKKVAPYIGAEIATINQIPKDFRQAYQDIYGVVEYPTVVSVVPGSPAATKLKAGDVLLSVNGKEIPQKLQGIKKFQQSLYEENLNVVVSRKGKDVKVSLKPVLACDSPVSFIYDSDINAYADGKNIFVSSGMMRFVDNDNQLALIIGHELAHNARKHVEAKQGNALIGVLIGGIVMAGTGVDVTSSFADIGAAAYSQQFESEADYVGLYYTARAGYDISSAPQVWRKMASENPGSIHLAGSTHPSSAVRFVALDSAVKEIAGKKSRGQSLLPEEKKIEPSEPKSAINN